MLNTDWFGVPREPMNDYSQRYCDRLAVLSSGVILEKLDPTGVGRAMVVLLESAKSHGIHHPAMMCSPAIAAEVQTLNP